MAALNDVYQKDPKLATIMETPTLSAADKSSIITELQKHTAGQDKSQTVKNFLDTLASYNRLGLLKGVCAKFEELMSASKGEVELLVTSAQVSSYVLGSHRDEMLIVLSNWMAGHYKDWRMQFPNLLT